MAQGEKIIGIDLGTTNSVVAVRDGNEPTVIANQEGGRTTPSVIAFNDKGETLVGASARNQRVTNPHRTIYSVCLLYTSPSPRDQRGSRMPSSA